MATETTEVTEELDKLTNILTTAGIEQQNADEIVTTVVANAAKEKISVMRALTEFARTGEGDSDSVSLQSQLHIALKGTEPELLKLTKLY